MSILGHCWLKIGQEGTGLMTQCERLRSLVLSRLDYGCSTLAGLSNQLLARLQSVLNDAVWLIFARRRYDHVTPVTPLLRSLHWLAVPERITYQLVVIVYRCLHGSAPAYLTSELFPRSQDRGRHRLRSSWTTDLIIPRVRHAMIAGRAFAASATSAWNSISDSTRPAQLLNTSHSS